MGPISNGDAARLYALCGDLGLVESGLYHAAYTEVSRMEAILVALITGGLSLLGVVITNIMAARRAEQRMVTARRSRMPAWRKRTREVRAHNSFASGCRCWKSSCVWQTTA